MSYRFQTQYNAMSFPRRYEVPVGASMTIPDQTMSISEIMDRYARGIPFEDAKTPVYNGDEYIPDVKTMELTDQMDLRESTRDQILKLQKQLQKPKAKPAKSELEKRIEALEAPRTAPEGPKTDNVS